VSSGLNHGKSRKGGVPAMVFRKERGTDVLYVWSLHAANIMQREDNQAVFSLFT